MGAYPYFYIEIFNHNSNEWEKYDVLTKNKNGKYVPADLWPWNGSHDLFSIVGLEDSYDFPKFTAIHEGFPVNASDEMYKEYGKFEEENFMGSYMPSVKWFNLADAMLYIEKNPTVKDIDAMEETWYAAGDIEWKDVPVKTTDNPLKHLVDRALAFLEAANEFRYWEWKLSDVRIICWKDW